jgi:hypothetical protein
MTDDKSREALDSRCEQIGKAHNLLSSAWKILHRIKNDDELYESEGLGEISESSSNSQVVNILGSVIYFNLRNWSQQKDQLEKQIQQMKEECCE